MLGCDGCCAVPQGVERRTGATASARRSATPRQRGVARDARTPISSKYAQVRREVAAVGHAWIPAARRGRQQPRVPGDRQKARGNVSLRLQRKRLPRPRHRRCVTALLSTSKPASLTRHVVGDDHVDAPCAGAWLRPRQHVGRSRRRSPPAPGVAPLALPARRQLREDVRRRNEPQVQRSPDRARSSASPRPVPACSSATAAAMTSASAPSAALHHGRVRISRRSAREPRASHRRRGRVWSARSPASPSAPVRARPPRRSRMPMRPLERLPMKRTGSMISSVGPAVTTIRRPMQRSAPRRSSRSAASTTASGSAESALADPAARQIARRPDRRSCTPRALSGRHVLPHRRVLEHVACSSPAPSAPAPSSRDRATTGSRRRCRCANLPMTFAVAGATSSKADARGERDVLDVGVRAGATTDSVITRRRVIASNVSFADELPRRSRHDGLRRRARASAAGARLRRPCRRRCRRSRRGR